MATVTAACRLRNLEKAGGGSDRETAASAAGDSPTLDAECEDSSRPTADTGEEAEPLRTGGAGRGGGAGADDDTASAVATEGGCRRCAVVVAVSSCAATAAVCSAAIGRLPLPEGAELLLLLLLLLLGFSR